MSSFQKTLSLSISAVILLGVIGLFAFSIASHADTPRPNVVEPSPFAQFLRDNARASTVIRVYKEGVFICQSVPHSDRPPGVDPSGNYLDFPSSAVPGIPADVIRLSLKDVAYMQKTHPNIKDRPEWLEIFFWK